MKIDNKKIREVKWTTEHSLTSAARNEIITQKVNRAKQEIETLIKAKSKLHA